jgi:hypothetical protein
MRSSKSRSRNKQNRQRSLGNIINRVFDSSGPEGKVRGTPQQIIEKYLMLARDAQLSSDRVAEQAFLQHAEHYTRMLGEAQKELAREQEMRQAQGGGQNGNGQGEGRGEGRERQDQRLVRDEDGDQPDFAPLGEVAGEDEGPGLVETPEMYHAPQPATFEGHVPDFLGGAANQAREDRPRRDRAPRERGADRPATEAAQAAERAERGPRRDRGPRRPRAGAAEGSDMPPDPPSAPAASEE